MTFCVSTKSFAEKRYFLLAVKKRQTNVSYKVILERLDLSFLHRSQKMSSLHETFCANINVLKYIRNFYFYFFNILKIVF